jgi:hypothetical protein
MEEALQRIRAVLETTAPRWSNLTETLPRDLLDHPPAPGEWSAAQCLQHLLDAERQVFPVRLRALLAGQERLAPFDPEAQEGAVDGQSPAELAAAFARLRAESLALLGGVTPEDLARAAEHGELGRVTLGELLHEWAAHDLMHTVQAERALMQPFIPGSGPWRHYFRDHDVAAPAGG